MSLTSDGGLKMESTNSYTTVNANDFKREGDGILSTARTPFGNPATTLTKDSIITHEGMDMSLQTAHKLGLVSLKNGEYSEASEQPSSTQDEPEQDMSESMGDKVEAQLTELANMIPVDFQTRVAESMISNGKIDYQNMGQTLGINSVELQQRVGVAEQAFRNQADKVLMSAGIGKEDLQGFVQWATSNKGEEFKRTQREQVYGRDTRGYQALARAYLNANAPAVSSIPESYKPRTLRDGTTLVTLPGYPEMKLQVATKLGLI
ncbi:hypothetical protein [Sulfurirhabdus autotrophica]|nr:hypothetical protein [Sulfurirhabdus autotrophica]